jgi:hypothetical protein
MFKNAELALRLVVVTDGVGGRLVIETVATADEKIEFEAEVEDKEEVVEEDKDVEYIPRPLPNTSLVFGVDPSNPFVLVDVSIIDEEEEDAIPGC